MGHLDFILVDLPILNCDLWFSSSQTVRLQEGTPPKQQRGTHRYPQIRLQKMFQIEMVHQVVPGWISSSHDGSTLW